MQLTLGREFYGRLTRAMEQHDLVTLASLYHPDAVQLSADTRQVLRGTAAIVAPTDSLLQAVGPVRTVSADKFVECGDVLCVEATQALRFQQVQTYDVFVLRAGAVQFQLSGMIASRAAALPQPPGGPPTPERRIFDSLHSAEGARDYARLRDLISADAVDIFASAGVTSQGRDAILEAARRDAHQSGPSKLKAVTCMVEAPGLIGAEAVVTKTARLPAAVSSAFPAARPWICTATSSCSCAAEPSGAVSLDSSHRDRTSLRQSSSRTLSKSAMRISSKPK